MYKVDLNESHLQRSIMENNAYECDFNLFKKSIPCLRKVWMVSTAWGPFDAGIFDALVHLNYELKSYVIVVSCDTLNAVNSAPKMPFFLIVYHGNSSKN